MIIEARDDTITLRGAIKKNIWPAIQAAAALLLENHPIGIIVDASAVSYCSPKGAETFADAFEYINAHHARIVVAGLSEELLEISKSVPGVRSQVSVADNVEDARASLDLEEVTPRRGKAREAAVIPMIGNWRRAVFLAGKLSMGESCEAHLVDFIKVPRALPIGSPLPERESEGQARLEEAKTIIKSANIVNFSHVERVRSQSAGLVEFAKQIKGTFSVINTDVIDKKTPVMDEAEAHLLLETVEFETSLDMGAPVDPYQPITHPIVPAVGAWEHALEHTCKLVHGSDAQVKVIYLISVPRTEPIDAPKPDMEAAADDCSKEAARIAKKYGAHVDVSVERVRDPILGFIKLFENRKYDMSVVGVKRGTSGEYQVAYAIAEALLHESPCETMFLRVGDY